LIVVPGAEAGGRAGGGGGSETIKVNPDDGNVCLVKKALQSILRSWFRV
jgi:hypothetical protein